MNTKARRLCGQNGVRAELHGVRRNGKVALHTNARVTTVPKTNRHPRQCRKLRRRLELRIETADRESETWALAIIEPKGSVAGYGECGDVGIVQRRVDRDLLGIAVPCAQYI